MAPRGSDPVSVERITRAIAVLRGQRVLLDSELAASYGVTTGRLNEAVERNIMRFPEDFMFRLSLAEHGALISQIATSNPGRGQAARSARYPQSGRWGSTPGTVKRLCD
jgi:hypothetical protein